ncbi:hypothetical protein KIN20_017219 [Parelaphostrongylus tenuis]|uniref:Uncharacterized protein n=1 Tax=Parelaphostrongylus tenuis TaxID=148309 RepID=A0AAD5QTM9_PARTN|nr:hypothetical protein KIN20_017219 [Parelaphostrongylus tenuis]
MVDVLTENVSLAILPVFLHWSQVTVTQDVEMKKGESSCKECNEFIRLIKIFVDLFIVICRRIRS